VLVRLKLAENLTLPGRVLQIVTDQLPALRAGAVSPWNGIDREGQLVARLVAMIAILIMLSVLVLSAAGIYALTSFTVTQRWREIGVRTALGGTSARVLTGVFSRVAMQVGLGIAVGIGAAIALEPLLGKDVPRLEGPIPAVVVLVMVVGFAASAGPARRALRIQPTDALRRQ
jgi:ABC-type antimicrobial peptide transport system permease subunit